MWSRSSQSARGARGAAVDKSPSPGLQVGHWRPQHSGSDLDLNKAFKILCLLQEHQREGSNSIACGTQISTIFSWNCGHRWQNRLMCPIILILFCILPEKSHNKLFIPLSQRRSKHVRVSHFDNVTDESKFDTLKSLIFCALRDCVSYCLLCLCLQGRKQLVRHGGLPRCRRWWRWLSPTQPGRCYDKSSSRWTRRVAQVEKRSEKARDESHGVKQALASSLKHSLARESRSRAAAILISIYKEPHEGNCSTPTPPPPTPFTTPAAHHPLFPWRNDKNWVWSLPTPKLL